MKLNLVKSFMTCPVTTSSFISRDSPTYPSASPIHLPLHKCALFLPVPVSSHAVPSDENVLLIPPPTSTCKDSSSISLYWLHVLTIAPPQPLLRDVALVCFIVNLLPLAAGLSENKEFGFFISDSLVPNTARTRVHSIPRHSM